MSESAAQAGPTAPGRGPEGTGTVEAVMSELKSARESRCSPGRGCGQYGATASQRLQGPRQRSRLVRSRRRDRLSVIGQEN